MEPLSRWRQDATDLDVLAYCAKHSYPLLVHHTGGYQLIPIERAMETIDRAVLSPSRRGRAPSANAEYLAVRVVALRGPHAFELTVGCTPSCDVRINDVTVSKHHATMTRDRHGNWYLQDAGSTTGTHVNDADPEPTQVLKSGDRIGFGMVELVFHLPASVYELVRTLP